MMTSLVPCVFSGVTETSYGRVRTRNEDAAGLRDALGLFVVCDGVGTHRDGAVASRMAVQLVLDHVASCGMPDTVTAATRLLLDAIETANEAVYCAGHALRPGRALRPMGTTLVATWLLYGRAIVAHAGDSRCYRMRGRSLRRLTRDHRLENDRELARRLDRNRPGFSLEHRHVLTRALGHSLQICPDVQVINVRPGDRFLLCSDGLTEALRDQEIAAILSEHRAPDEAARALVRAADEAGGPDNTTVVVAAPRALS